MFGLILQKMFATVVTGMTVAAYSAGLVYPDAEIVSTVDPFAKYQPPSIEQMAEHVMDGVDEVYGWDGYYSGKAELNETLDAHNMMNSDLQSANALDIDTQSIDEMLAEHNMQVEKQKQEEEEAEAEAEADAKRQTDELAAQQKKEAEERQAELETEHKKQEEDYKKEIEVQEEEMQKQEDEYKKELEAQEAERQTMAEQYKQDNGMEM